MGKQTNADPDNVCLPWDSFDVKLEFDYDTPVATGPEYFEGDYCRNPIQYLQYYIPEVHVWHAGHPWCYSVSSGSLKRAECADLPYCGESSHLECQSFQPLHFTEGQRVKVFLESFPARLERKLSTLTFRPNPHRTRDATQIKWNLLM